MAVTGTRLQLARALIFQRCL